MARLSLELIIYCLLFLLVSYQVAGTTPYGSFQMNRLVRSSFTLIGEVDKDLTHTVVIAVKQNNIDILESTLIERSSPGSPLLRQWLSYDEVSVIISNPESTNAVIEWVKSLNNAQVLWSSPRGEYIKVSAPLSTWETTFSTIFYKWHDSSVPDGRDVIRAKEYTIPIELNGHISSVFNTIQVPPTYRKSTARKSQPVEPSGLKGRRLTSVASNAVTVSFLNSYYKISTNEGNSSLKQSVFESLDVYYSTEDLTTFQNLFDLPVQAAIATNGFSTSVCGNKDCYEGNLDIQYIMGVAQDTTSIYDYQDDSSTEDVFLAWILSVASETDPPLVNSISYGEIEQAVDASTLYSFNVEAIKLGSMGVTITVSSGDNGAANEATINSNTVCLCYYDSSSDIVTYSSHYWTGEGYFPSFPASCPYVTAVGATMGPNNGGSEDVCEADKGGVITSGGGFSTYYNQSSWQKEAVTNFLSKQTPTSGYNKYGRAYPDISFIGVEYAVVVNGVVGYLYGTSCSSPVFAAMISILNAQRSRYGLSSLGFLNPSLYEAGYQQLAGNGTFYNDVSSGNNKCCSNSDYPFVPTVCCSSGFVAEESWDAATGWGSIDFTRLAVIFDTIVPVYASRSPSSNPVISTTIIAVIAVVVVVAFLLFVVFKLRGRIFNRKTTNLGPNVTINPLNL